MQPRAGRRPDEVAAQLAELSPGRGRAAAARRRPRRRGHDRVGPPHGLPGRGRDPGRGADRPPAAGPPRRRHRRAARARSGWPSAAAAPRPSRSTRCRRAGHHARDAALVARTAAGAAFDVVRRVELLLDHWGVAAAQRAAQRRAGRARPEGGGARAARRRGRRRPDRRGGPGGRPDRRGGRRRRHARVWLPTDEFDLWSGRPTRRAVGAPGRRVARRAAGSRRWSARATRRASRGTRSPPSSRAGCAEEARRLALQVLAELPDGEVLADRHRHRLARAADRLAASAPARGLRRPRHGGAGRGCRAGRDRRRRAAAERPRVVADGDLPAAAEAIAADLPRPVDHVLLQADLTAVAPGPLETEVARRLHLLADVESRGGATVYRFTSGSLRRGLRRRLVQRSRCATSSRRSRRRRSPSRWSSWSTTSPAPSARVRVGHAEAFLRADDEAALAALVHDPQGPHPRPSPARARPSRSRPRPSTYCCPRLRELGAAPVVEARRRHGPGQPAATCSAPAARRGRRPAGAVEARRAAQVQAVATAIRAGDRAESSRPATRRGDDHARRARWPPSARRSRRGSTVVIGYVDNHGATGERVVDPRRLDGGRLSAYDHRADDVREFAVHRITGVSGLALNTRACVAWAIRRLHGGLHPVRRARGGARQRRPARRGGAARAPRRPLVAAPLRGRGGRARRCRPSRPSCGRCSRPPTSTTYASWSSSLNDLLAEPPGDADDQRPRPRAPPHARRQPRRLRRRAADRRVADGAGQPGLRPRRHPARASARSRAATTSSSTPPPTSRAATARTGAPRAPTSRPSARGAADRRRLPRPSVGRG